MADSEPAFHQDIQKLLETTLPDGATPKEREEFARGLTLLAELLGEFVSATEASES